MGNIIMGLISYLRVQKGSTHNQLEMSQLFQVESLHDENPEWWADKKTFLLIGLVPDGLNTSERKYFILKTLKFTIIDAKLYHLGKNVILHQCVLQSARQEIIHEARAGELVGHFAADITVNFFLQVGLWWESMTPNVIHFAGNR